MLLRHAPHGPLRQLHLFLHCAYQLRHKHVSQPCFPARPSSCRNTLFQSPALLPSSLERLHILYAVQLPLYIYFQYYRCTQMFLTGTFYCLCFLGESPVPSVSSGASSPLCTSTVTPALIQAKPSSSSQQDRKVPPPIGTERLARIRQTGSVNHAMLPTSYTPPVGQGGIWSFGVGSASGE